VGKTGGWRGPQPRSLRLRRRIAEQDPRPVEPPASPGRGQDGDLTESLGDDDALLVKPRARHGGIAGRPVLGGLHHVYGRAA